MRPAIIRGQSAATIWRNVGTGRAGPCSASRRSVLSFPARWHRLQATISSGRRAAAWPSVTTPGGMTETEKRVLNTIVHADDAAGWDRLLAHCEMHRINHSVAFSLDGACTNWAAPYFSRLRRAEMGQHHHIRDKYLVSYAREMAWKGDNRRVANGNQHQAVTAAALAHPVSRGVGWVLAAGAITR